MISDGSQKPAWSYSDYVLITRLGSSDHGRLFFLENLEHNYPALSYFQAGDKLIISIGFYFDKWNFEYAKRCFIHQNPQFNLQDIYWLGNNASQVEIAKDVGFSAIQCNQNSFVDENIFTILNEEKIYRMVMNARPELMKRPWLAKNVEGLAVIQGKNYAEKNFWDLKQLNPQYINEDRITRKQVAQILNQSFVGGIFSEKEGACFASSEYLLCGLPVVSTASVGGRDFWYNDRNSIIAQDNEEAIADAVNTLIAQVQSKAIDPREIRLEHMILAHLQRDTLVSLLNELSTSLRLEISGSFLMYKIIREWATIHALADMPQKLFWENGAS
jgi:glycosyltransferase involved in cell wall biosynthesis